MRIVIPVGFLILLGLLWASNHFGYEACRVNCTMAELIQPDSPNNNVTDWIERNCGR
jgi:hypothetical protein